MVFYKKIIFPASQSQEETITLNLQNFEASSSAPSEPQIQEEIQPLQETQKVDTEASIEETTKKLFEKIAQAHASSSTSQSVKNHTEIANLEETTKKLFEKIAHAKGSPKKPKKRHSKRDKQNIFKSKNKKIKKYPKNVKRKNVKSSKNKTYKKTKKQKFIKKKKIQKKQKKLSNMLMHSGSNFSHKKKSSSSSMKMIKQFYGAEFNSFTGTQKTFIKNNLGNIYRITQRTLTHNGYPDTAVRTQQQGTQLVTFYLHPNGSISKLHYKKRLGFASLDKNTIKVIKIAYKDYPRPKTTTKITFRVEYSLY